MQFCDKKVKYFADTKVQQVFNSAVISMKKLKLENHHSNSIQPLTPYDQKLMENHPNSLLPHIANLTFDQASLRFAAIAAYIHPVTIRPIETRLKKIIPKQGYWAADTHLEDLLETLNVFCLTHKFDYKALNLTDFPNVEEGSYCQALWINCLPSLSRNQHFLECQVQMKKVSKRNTLLVRAFIQSVVSLKQSVLSKELPMSPEGTYHDIDLALEDEGIMTIDYLPSDYRGELIEVWVDRSVELNSLYGNFVCKEKFGEFEYVRGPLMYAMEKGILIVFNNFEQISNQLLVSLKSLAEEGCIHHNQKVMRASAGFKMLGVCNHKGPNTKTKNAIIKIVQHFPLPERKISTILPIISNQQNKMYLLSLFNNCKEALGYAGLLKLWKRISRIRSILINSIEPLEYIKAEDIQDKLWNSYFTEQFLAEIALEIRQLKGDVSAQSRMIHCAEKYKKIIIGRAELAVQYQPVYKIVKTQYSLAVLERLIICSELGQCPLLVSETGCGKTTLVQYLAELGGHKLYVYNMSSGTDVSDLVGGFKPIDCRVLLKELFEQFVERFRKEVIEAEKNEAYLSKLMLYYQQSKFKVLLESLIQSIPKITEKVSGNTFEWKEMQRRFANIYANLDRIDSNLVFSFLEGNLLRAMRNGDWILIDEINLATNDVLQKIIPLVEGKSLMLYEKGDLHFVERHADFRIIACMNPANDSGKKALPGNLGQKFTTITMHEPSRLDVEMMVRDLCPQLNESDIADLYCRIKLGKTVSLRNLTRAINYINRNKETYGWHRALYDGLMLGFAEREVLSAYKNTVIPKVPVGFIEMEGFLLSRGPNEPNFEGVFHLTETFKQHLTDLLRAISGTELPVLLEGPTSAGKTSMIQHVAKSVGYRCIRINNHQHTEIEEYIGNYFPDKTGKLVFREGPLVQAVRQGYWLILDELNLARTEILECLNRLLDDNRELFIPEQQKHIKPHSSFRIFATQNPASYSGRKTLSRAFRNRFVSISFDDINITDTMAILEARSPLLRDSKELALFVKKTLEDLGNYRQRQQVFQKDGLITIRNLLKWSQRKYVNKEKFIMEGYAILAQKLRNEEEKSYVERVLLGGIHYTRRHLLNEYREKTEALLNAEWLSQSKIFVQVNDSFTRMTALTLKAIDNHEPVLLVGETGCGKTTLAQLLAQATSRKFFSINCHKHMEASDLLGSLRPCIRPDPNHRFQFVNGVVIDAMLQGGVLLIDEINTAEDSVLQRLNQLLQSGTIGVERGQGWETIEAKEGFCIIATMNPSGDFGKKELSPALRNRFTEIWVQPITHPQYILNAKADIVKMINHKLDQPSAALLSELLFDFIVEYNCHVAPKFSLLRKLLTMRDIGWVCAFINKFNSGASSWKEAYYWSLRVLAIEGVTYMMSESPEGIKLADMKDHLIKFVAHQIDMSPQCLPGQHELAIIEVLSQMSFPLLIRSDLPLQVLGIVPDSKIFFSPQTDLSDLLGQYRPANDGFIWHDGTLLKRVKQGGRLGLVDLNMAQQQVVEGINSLFDHRGSLFVVELNQTYHKHSQFRPVVLLRSENGNGRKGLPNSFLNRFVKIAIKDVSVDTKINYLIRKYPQLTHHQSIALTSATLLSTFPIQQVQLFLQLSFNQCSQPALHIISAPMTVTHTEINYEKQLLSVFPVNRNFGLTSQQSMQLFLKMYLVLTRSKFSICLVGESGIRARFVAALGYFLHKQPRKVLLSTMTDMSDLLGSYEQVTGEAIDEEVTLSSTILQRTSAQEVSYEGSRFVYVESKIVEALRREECLVYVDVPNASMLERIEKGLGQVQAQEKQIIIGISQLESSRIGNSLVFFRVPAVTLQEEVTVTKETYEYYPHNSSNLTHLDGELRADETVALIHSKIDQEAQRETVAAWRKLLRGAETRRQTQFDSLNWQELYNQELSRSPITYKPNPLRDSLTQLTLRNCIASHNANEHQNKLLLHLFLSESGGEFNRLISYFSREEEKLHSVVTKFQTLYACNLGQFRSDSLKVLSTLFTSRHPHILNKFYEQIDKLHTDLFLLHIKEILIQFNELEHTLVPVYDSRAVFRYTLNRGANIHVLRLCAEGVHFSHVFQGVERVVLRNVDEMRVEIGQVTKWVAGLKVKHIGEQDIVFSKLNAKLRIGEDLLECQEVREFVSQVIKDNPCMMEMLLSDDPRRGRIIGSHLLDLFKPSQDMSENVSYHLKNEVELRALENAIRDDEQLLKVWSELCRVKYFGYRPKGLVEVAHRMEECHRRMQEIAKLRVYRGHHNINQLTQFYTHLLRIHTATNTATNTAHMGIISVLNQTYESYYDTYNDVLLPYYLALLLLNKQDPSSSEIPLTIGLLVKKENPLETLLTRMVGEGEEFHDRSKDHVILQKKFNRTVIVDEYTAQGVERNKRLLEQEFNDLFGKKGVVMERPYEHLHMVLNKTVAYRHHLRGLMLKESMTYETLIIASGLLLSGDIDESINIYEEGSPALLRYLVEPLPKVLLEVRALLAVHQTDNIKQLATLAYKIYEHSLFAQVYQVLTDCEFLVESILQVNSILPMSLHIKPEILIQRCLYVRKLELRNWRLMLDLKIARTQQSDMIQFPSFLRMIGTISNPKEMFIMCEAFLRESTLACLSNRMQLLRTIPNDHLDVQRVLGFYEYLQLEAQKHQSVLRQEKEAEMKEFEKLAGWSSKEYLIFKATCQKFQRKVHHILKRYDEGLSMKVGVFHQQLQHRQIFHSIPELQSHLTLEEQNDFTESIDYVSLTERIFSSLKELKEDHHSSQSKLLIIRAYVSELEDVFEGFTMVQQESKCIVPAMFESGLQYGRASKHYFGLWDKLCQRKEEKWNRELVARMWTIVQKLWVEANRMLELYPIHTHQHIQELTLLFQGVKEASSHELIRREIARVKKYILEKQEDSRRITQEYPFKVDQQLRALMRLGYILASITLNLQKNGLCVKEDEQEGSGTEEVADGMGIGEGDVHQQAQNIGDQIQFEEQVQGNKDEEKNEDNKGEKEEENDIEMEGEFEGQMHSKEEEEEGKQEEGKQEEEDEQMGSVDQDKREEDMKNEEGKGKEEMELDVKGQKGEEELVDNEQVQKEERRGEDRQGEEEEEEEERSDWEDGEINKQEEGQQQEESNREQQNEEQQRSGEVDSEMDIEQNEQEEMQAENEKSAMEQEEDEQGDEQGEDESQNEQGDESQNESQNEQGNAEEEQPPKHKKQDKNYGAVYGRKDINTRNEIKEQAENEAEGGGREGEGEQGDGAGGGVHNLSVELMSQIQKMGVNSKADRVKDVNVMVNDQEYESDHGEQPQQYELTEQEDHKLADLPVLLDIEGDRQQKEKDREQKEREKKIEKKIEKEKKRERDKGKEDMEGVNQGIEEQQPGIDRSIPLLQSEKYDPDYEKKKREIKERETKERETKGEGEIEIEQARQERIKQMVSSINNGRTEEISGRDDGRNERNVLEQAYETSRVLEQQLKSVLQPLDNAEYRGDFKTGKKLNLRKIIPFIASNYRKDRIWLRRSEPSQRNYHIMLGLDDTKSMHYGSVGIEALKGLLAISLALQHLSIKTSVCAIRERTHTLKPFESQLDCTAILRQFSFAYESSNSHELSMAEFMRSSLLGFEEARSGEERQLCLIISDGKMSKELVRPYMREAKRKEVTYVFIIVDSPGASVLNIRTVKQVGGKMQISQYMADFPFQYFLVVNNVKELGEILALTLLQFIQAN